MKSSKDFVLQQNLAILNVGPPGSGKTRLGMAFPKPGFLDFDGNMTSAARIAGKEFYFTQAFHLPILERWPQVMKDTMEFIKAPEIETIVGDGLSTLCRWGLDYAEQQLINGGINVKKEYLAKYQAFIPLLTNYITLLRTSKKYVIVNVHQILEKDELSGRVLYKLDIPGRLADNLGGQFTDVWGMSSEPDPGSKVGAKYFINTKPTGYHVNLKTSLDLEPRIDITGKTPNEIWSILEPRLSINLPKVTPPTVSPPTSNPLGIAPRPTPLVVGPGGNVL